jgi:hypothetical protein
MANPSRMKREIDKAKKERAAEKRERRQRAGTGDTDAVTLEGGSSPAPAPSPMPNDEVLRRLEELHVQFDADELDFEAFERQRDALLAQLATE